MFFDILFGKISFDGSKDGESCNYSSIHVFTAKFVKFKVDSISFNLHIFKSTHFQILSEGIETHHLSPHHLSWDYHCSISAL